MKKTNRFVVSTPTGKRTSCPISYALEIFGDRWTLIVLRDLLFGGRRRYRELLSAGDGIATNILADRLKRLERRGLLSKSRDPQDARQHVYTPTEAAIGLVPMLFEMIAWSAANGQLQIDNGLLQRIKDDRAALVRDTQKRIRQASIAD